MRSTWIVSRKETTLASNSAKWPYKAHSITIGRGIEYGMLDLMGGGWNNIVSGVIFAYLTLAQGFNPAIAGSIAAAGRIVDCIWNLFLGLITDNFYKTKLGQKFGRRHFFMALGLVLFACVFPLFWISSTSWVYYLVVYVAMEIIIAMMIVPWECLPTEMTRDYKQRTTLSGSRMVISATGTALVFLILAALKQANNPNAYLIAGIAWTVLFVIAIFISTAFTWERPLTEDFIKELDSRPKQSVGEVLKESLKGYADTFKNQAFRTHLAVYLLSFTGKDFYSTLLPTFIACCISGAGDSWPWTFQAMSILGIPMTIYCAKLMISHGPRFLFRLSYISILIAMVAYVAVWAMGIHNPFWIFLIVSIIYQCGRATLEFTPWNLFPFMPDVDYIMTRGDRAGLYASVMTFCRKSTGAIATWVAGILLEFTGYKADTMKSFDTTPHNVQVGIVLVFFLGTCILIAWALWLSRHIYLDRETHGVLKAEIERLEQGGDKKDVSDEARKVAEELTGHPYEKLWPALDKNGRPIEQV
ncbi:MFS transporter [Bifidobacterium callimiconis]|uniref:MFS transporter n=1 Tax=Bifidobacterium callimiconis TaxID=2306973 RepID=A0A430FC76_9BIFI|nr:MFS transporter [Bifidobacterium callimiconis]